VNQEQVIFSRGATLRDVPDDFKGISREEFLRRDTTEQCREYLKSLPPPETLAASWDWKGREWQREKIHGPRDNYGWRSL
jgi:hypothetical protein